MKSKCSGFWPRLLVESSENSRKDGKLGDAKDDTNGPVGGLGLGLSYDKPDVCDGCWIGILSTERNSLALVYSSRCRFCDL